MNKIINNIKELSFKKKIQLIVAVLLTTALLVSIPVYAWFTNQKKAAELYKIEYPNSLYLNAAHREDRMYFNLDELNLDEYYLGEDNKPINYGTAQNPIYRERTQRLYAFSVSGEGITNFTLQLAHTNNNELKYKIYEAVQSGTKPPSGDENFDYVHYERHMETGDNSENPLSFSDDLKKKDAYYTKGDEVTLEFKNPDEDDEDGILAIRSTSDKYYKKTYGETNDNVQVNAVPSYFQTNVSLSRSDIDRNSKQFHKYYILEVSWDDSQENTKETDMIYLSVRRTA